MVSGAIGGLVWVLALIGAVVFLTLIVQYNGLVRLRQMVRNAWSDVDVYLKKRADLVPNLVEAVKAYASHEQRVLTAVVEARAVAAAAKSDLPKRADAETHLGNSLLRVLAVAEDYPELKASANFAHLQESLSETERHIASARQYYNACVRDFNTKVEAFPSNVVASIGSFKQAEFFEIEAYDEREVPHASLEP